MSVFVKMSATHEKQQTPSAGENKFLATYFSSHSLTLTHQSHLKTRGEKKHTLAFSLSLSLYKYGPMAVRRLFAD